MQESAPKDMVETLGLKILDFQPGETRGRIFIDDHICHYGHLSGGASLAIAECMAGEGERKVCPEGYTPLGLEVSGNHIHGAMPGQWLDIEGKLLHNGKTVHVWNIDISDEKKNLVCSVRLTIYIAKIRK